MSHAYSLVLPTTDEIKDRFNQSLELWKARNEFFAKIDMYLEGRNLIPVPTELQYEVRVARSYYMQSIVNEKAARFLLRPQLQVVPPGVGERPRQASTRLENAINSLQYWMEVRGDGDVWARVTADAIIYDQGVERIECAPAAFWPELVAPAEDDKEPLYRKWREKVNANHPMEEEKAYRQYRERYKMEQGAPIRSVYVPPPQAYPIYEGPTAVEMFEVDRRSLRSILHQPIFSGEGLERLRGVVNSTSMSQKDIINTEATILHYDNQMWHAYYVLAPTINRNIEHKTKWPSGILGGADTIDSIGEPILLHAYPHNVGKTIYNIVGGRNGGWKTTHNRIEATMDALCELQQMLDEIMTTAATNVKQFGIPQMVEIHDNQMRDIGQGVPVPTKIKPGQPIALWKGEEIRPLFPNTDNPTLRWQFDQIINQMERLSGSAAIYGQQDPGVRTGYHANLQISQSEHLDEKLEAHLVAGAINRGYLIMRHLRQLEEPLPIHYRYTDRSGRKLGEYITITPKQLDPLPELDASVRKPRPIDYDAALRAALSASQDRGGPGTPLLDDDTIRERILGEDAPDVIEMKIAIQNERRKLLSSGVLSAEIGKALGLEMARRASPTVTEDQVAGADRGLLQAVSGIANDGTAAAAGGISPSLAQRILSGSTAAGVPQLNDQGGPPPPNPANIIPAQPPAGMPAPSAINGVGGGTAPGTPQPEQALARAVAMAARARTQP